MLRYGSLSKDELHELQSAVRDAVARADCFEHAARTFTELVRAAFKDSTPLLRLFLTSRLDTLPAPLAQTASRCAVDAGHPLALEPSTLVLTLLGSAGRRPEWNNRHTSAGHKAIPLASRKFVDSIPMVASLLAELELPIDAAQPGALASRVLGGGWYGVFFVKDAASALDLEGRRIIPAQGFVDEEGLKSVWGIGVAYPTGVVATLIAFTREELERAQVEALVPLMRAFKVSTTQRVQAHRIFIPEEGPAPRLSPLR